MGRDRPQCGAFPVSRTQPRGIIAVIALVVVMVLFTRIAGVSLAEMSSLLVAVAIVVDRLRRSRRKRSS